MSVCSLLPVSMRHFYLSVFPTRVVYKRFLYFVKRFESSGLVGYHSSFLQHHIAVTKFQG